MMALLVVITVLLREAILDSDKTSVLASSLYNLYYVPVLLAAMLLGETMCGVVALLAVIASCIAGNGFHWPVGQMAWFAVGIRGAFFLTLGFLAARIASQMRASARSLESLLEISRAINSSLDLDVTLLEITKCSVELTSADACAIRLLSEDGKELVYANSWGLSDRYLAKGPLSVDDPLTQQTLQSNGLIQRDVRRTKDLLYRDETIEEGVFYIINVPLRVEDRVIGLLNLYRKMFVGFTTRDRHIARAFAEQAAIALQNARLYDSIRKNYLDTVRALSRAIEANDSLSLGHSERVAMCAVNIAQGVEPPQCGRADH